MRNGHAKFAGFTIIELLATLVILALLATAATPLLQVTAKRNKEQELRRALWTIREAIDAYKQAVDDGLIPKSANMSGYPKTLSVLVEGVENNRDTKRGKIFFLRNLPRDPFNPMPDEPPEATWGKRSYASSAEEPKEGDDIYDVYTTSPGVGLNSVPYREW